MCLNWINFYPYPCCFPCNKSRLTWIQIGSIEGRNFIFGWRNQPLPAVFQKLLWLDGDVSMFFWSKVLVGNVITWMWLPHSNSDHQDYYIFSRESKPKPSFTTGILGRGAHPSYNSVLGNLSLVFLQCSWSFVPPHLPASESWAGNGSAVQLVAGKDDSHDVSQMLHGTGIYTYMNGLNL